MTENPYGLPLIADPEQDAIQLENQLDLYEKGRKLRKFVMDPDWELVVQILRDYSDKANDELTDLPPGHPKIMEAHAAASATKQVFHRFQEDINTAVDFANKPPEELKTAIHSIRRAVESAQNGR